VEISVFSAETRSLKITALLQRVDFDLRIAIAHMVGAVRMMGLRRIERLAGKLFSGVKKGVFILKHVGRIFHSVYPAPHAGFKIKYFFKTFLCQSLVTIYSDYIQRLFTVTKVAHLPRNKALWFFVLLTFILSARIH
jgi:hypothetical protein